MFDASGLEAWFITGSQHLYGEDTLAKVAEHSHEVVRGLSDPHPAMSQPASRSVP